MSEHTPGPWTALEAREDGLVHKSLRPYYHADVCVGPRETHGNSIARVSLGGPGATHNTREAVEANAKLIAAAPELLELAQRLASECAECDGRGFVYGDDGVSGRGPDDVEPTRIACAECADIRIVIDRATKS